VVTYAAGEIHIRRDSGRKAVVLCHYLGGAVTRNTANISDGRLTLQPLSHNAAGQPLEWIEVKIA
jgi:hypothetical protein